MANITIEIIQNAKFMDPPAGVTRGLLSAGQLIEADETYLPFFAGTEPTNEPTGREWQAE